MAAPAPGWYPDPGGSPGRYRYWDGRTWSAETSPQSPAPARGRPPIRWLVGAGVGLVVAVLVAVLVIRSLAGGPSAAESPTPGAPPASASCPLPDSAEPTSRPSVAGDGRVRGGPLSYPMLPGPWSPPETENRLSFGHDIAAQWVTVDTNAKTGDLWAAIVLISELRSGDGFFGPQQAAHLMAGCITGSLYGDNEVRSDPKIDKSVVVDGHPAWLLESRLSYQVDGLKTKGETMIIVIVDAGGSTGLFYAGLPDSGPEFVDPARQAWRELRVEA